MQLKNPVPMGNKRFLGFCVNLKEYGSVADLEQQCNKLRILICNNSVNTVCDLVSEERLLYSYIALLDYSE